MGTPTYAELQQSIVDRQAEIEAKRQAAQAAELARKEAEEAPRRAMAQAEAELEVLKRQARQIAYRELADKYQIVLQDVHRQVEESLAALQKYDVKGAIGLMRQAIALRETALNRRQSALAQIEPLEQEARRDVYNRLQDGQREFWQLARAVENDPQVASFNQYNLPEPPALLGLIYAWIEKVPEGIARQERRGLSFAAFGYLGNPVDGILINWSNLPIYHP